MRFPYQGQPEYPVKNKVNLFQTGNRELTSTRNIMNVGRRLLQVADKDIDLYLVGDSSEIAKLVFKLPTGVVLAEMYCIPKSHRLDIYDSEGLLVVYDRRKCTYVRATEAQKRFGITDIFKSLVALT